MAASVGTAGVGIKMLMRKDTGAIQIIGMLPGGPAKLSGMVQENDSLLKVGGKDVTGLKLEEVNKLLNGATGSKVRVKLSRAGMSFDVTLVRAEDSAGKKAPTATTAPPKPAEAPSGKKKLTDREKADRMLNGGVKHYGDDHNTEMVHASKEEAARLTAEQEKRIKEAQKEADRLYTENLRRDQEAKEVAKANGGAGSFELANPKTWFGGSEDHKHHKRKQEVHSSWNPCGKKEASPPTPPPPWWNPFAPKPEEPVPPKTWYRSMSDSFNDRTLRAKAAIVDVVVDMKVKEALGKPASVSEEVNVFCSSCGACSQPRK